MESQHHRIKVLTVIRSKHPFLRDEDAEAERAGGAGRSWCGVCSGAAPGPAFPAGFPHRAPQHPASAGCTAGLGAQVIRIQVNSPGKTMGSRWFHGTVQPAVVDVGDTIHVASGKPTLSPSVDPCHSPRAPCTLGQSRGPLQFLSAAAIHAGPRLHGDQDLFVLFTALAPHLAHKWLGVQFN